MSTARLVHGIARVEFVVDGREPFVLRKVLSIAVEPDARGTIEKVTVELYDPRAIEIMTQGIEGVLTGYFTDAVSQEILAADNLGRLRVAFSHLSQDQGAFARLMVILFPVRESWFRRTARRLFRRMP